MATGPFSGTSIPEAVDRNVAWIIICDEGHSSSLAAASLKHLGLPHVADGRPLADHLGDGAHRLIGKRGMSGGVGRGSGLIGGPP